ncbi:MAG: signal peptidase II [Candidatus Magasanikiibacteriota bacterium]
MKNKIHLTIYIVIGGFFLLLDQLLKYLARTNSDFSFYLWKNWLGWEYFPNPGIAFSLPVPNWLVVIFTPIILLGLFIWIRRTHNTYHISHITRQLSLFFIIAGAVSNYIDRVLFGVTIDYIRILTGVINLADVMIVVGVGLLLLDERLKKINIKL